VVSSCLLRKLTHFSIRLSIVSLEMTSAAWRSRSNSEGTVFRNSWDMVTGGCHETIVENLVALSSRRDKEKKSSVDSDKDPDAPSETNENNFSGSEDDLDIGSEFDFDSDLLDEDGAETPFLPSSSSTSRLTSATNRPQRHIKLQRIQSENERAPNYSTTKEGRKVIDAATIDQLVKCFAEETQDMVAIHHLILAHEHFVSSQEMFNKFVQLYKTPDADPAKAQVIQFRIVNIIKKWVEINWQQFESDKKLMNALDDFLGYLKDVNPAVGAFIDKAIATAKDPENLMEFETQHDERPNIIKPKRKKPKKGQDWELTDFDPREIARQITLIDHKLLRGVRLLEMLKTRWVRKQAPTVDAVADRINKFTYWLAFLIVNAQSPKKRIALLTHVIKIARYLVEMNNFNSLMAIYLALNLPSVVRLTQTWKGLPNKYYLLWKKICNLMNPRNNFRNYRKFSEGRSLPVIPCQEVILKDLLYYEEATEDFVGYDVIDTKKLDQMGKILDHVRMCQSKSYLFNEYPLLRDFLLTIKEDIQVEDLDRLSQLREPSSINFELPRTASQGRKASISRNVPPSILKDYQTNMKISSLPVQRQRAKSSLDDLQIPAVPQTKTLPETEGSPSDALRAASMRHNDEKKRPPHSEFSPAPQRGIRCRQKDHKKIEF